MSWRILNQISRFASTATQNVTKGSPKILDFNQIPGPKYYPILGALNDVIQLGKNERLHLTVDEMHKKYGNIFRIRIQSIDAVFLSSADYIRSIFAYEGKYPKHPIPPAWFYFNEKFNIQRGLLFMDDEEWLQHRQIMNNFLLKDMKWTEKLVEMTCDNFISKLKRILDSEDATVVKNLEDELYLWSIYSILNLMLGSSTSEQSDREFDATVWEFVTIVKQIFDTSSKLMSIPPRFADKIHMKVYRDFENAAQKSIAISRRLISILSNDMQSSENGLLHKMRSEHLSEDMIVRIFSDLIIAAGDTTVTTLQWMLHSIAKDSEFQDKLRKSIVDEPGNLESPLVRATLRESLRLYPVAPFVGRFIENDATIGGYGIPKGVLALASLYTSGRDPVNFTDAHKFIPDRWLRNGDQGEHKVFKSHATLPFAMGSRSCVGKKIASYQIHCLISKILKEFTLESRNKEDVNFKLKLIGVPDKKILIAFRTTMPFTIDINP
uniref:Cytochrome P450 n=1 Tax=Chironomus tentans TaxID=7153 RepID=A0A1W6R7J4_CHITE|nr:cytochrome P450 [Chironomus tentans]